MNCKRQSLLSLGHQQVTNQIPKSLTTKYQDYFHEYQQKPTTQLEKEQIDVTSIMIFQNFSQSNTPNTSTQQKITYSAKSSKGKQILRNFFPQKWAIQKSNLSPFSFSKHSNFQSITNRYWYYLDLEHQIQGPFSCIEMDNWYRKNLLHPDLLVSFKSIDLTAFIKVQELVQEKKQNYIDNVIKNMLKRSQSLIIQKLNGSTSSPSSKGSTENSNTNSCQKQRQVWQNEFIWIQ